MIMEQIEVCRALQQARTKAREILNRTNPPAKLDTVARLSMTFAIRCMCLALQAIDDGDAGL